MCYYLSNIFGKTTEYLLDMKQQYVNEISHRGFCRMDKNYMSTVRGQVFGTARVTALKHFPQTDSVFTRS